MTIKQCPTGCFHDHQGEGCWSLDQYGKKIVEEKQKQARAWQYMLNLQQDQPSSVQNHPTSCLSISFIIPWFSYHFCGHIRISQLKLVTKPNTSVNFTFIIRCQNAGNVTWFSLISVTIKAYNSNPSILTNVRYYQKLTPPHEMHIYIIHTNTHTFIHGVQVLITSIWLDPCIWF